MLTDHHDAQTRGAQDTRNQLRELAIAKHAGLTVRADVYLLEDLARRGQRFGEHGHIIGDAAGHAVQIHDRQRQEFCAGAVMAQNSQDAAARAMRLNSAAAIAAHLLLAKRAKPQPGAREIDFSDDAPPDPVLVFCAGDVHDIAHEFVAERAFKTVIATQDFNIRIADSRQAHADQRPARLQSRLRLLHQRKMISTCDGGEHPNFGGLHDSLQAFSVKVESAPERHWSTGCSTGQSCPNKALMVLEQSLTLNSRSYSAGIICSALLAAGRVDRSGSPL